jgi:hypothetical protein
MRLIAIPVKVILLGIDSLGLQGKLPDLLPQTFNL